MVPSIVGRQQVQGRGTKAQGSAAAGERSGRHIGQEPLLVEEEVGRTSRHTTETEQCCRDNAAPVLERKQVERTAGSDSENCYADSRRRRRPGSIQDEASSVGHRRPAPTATGLERSSHWEGTKLVIEGE